MISAECRLMSPLGGLQPMGGLPKELPLQEETLLVNTARIGEDCE